MNSCLYKFETLLISFPIAELVSVDDVRSKVEKISEYIAEYKFLIQKMISIGIDDDTHQNNLDRMIDFIKEGNERMKAIRDLEFSERENRKLRDADEKAKKEEEEIKLKKDKENVVVNRLIAEISLIEKDILKIKDISISDLEDSKLLDQEQTLSFLESEISKLSSKITSLVEQMPLDFPNREEVTKKYGSKEKEIKARFESFKKRLVDEIRERNIGNEEKSNSSYKIKLEKFKGYESAIDIYSFQSEFEKCHQKSVQKKLLPDYLKNNYLEGTALSLVRSIDNLDGIWHRLKEAYGDTELLLENKLQEIVKMDEIWKIRDKEKLVHTLSKLVSVMLELRTLAEKHGIENELYYGGGIQKVYKIVGHIYSNRFIRKYSGTKPSKKDCWNNLVEFLADEIKFQEEIILKDRLLQEDTNKSYQKEK